MAKRSLHEKPSLAMDPYHRNVFVPVGQRMREWRLDPYQVRYATDVIEHSPFEQEFYDCLPIAMELFRGPFNLLSVEIMDGMPFRFAQDMRYAPYSFGPPRSYRWMFLHRDGREFGFEMSEEWIYRWKQRDAVSWFEYVARDIERHVLEHLQKERSERT